MNEGYGVWRDEGRGGEVGRRESERARARETVSLLRCSDLWLTTLSCCKIIRALLDPARISIYLFTRVLIVEFSQMRSREALGLTKIPT
jgi:hypothetical protein